MGGVTQQRMTNRSEGQLGCVCMCVYLKMASESNLTTRLKSLFCIHQFHLLQEVTLKTKTDRFGMMKSQCARTCTPEVLLKCIFPLKKKNALLTLPRKNFIQCAVAEWCRIMPGALNEHRTEEQLLILQDFKCVPA